MTILATPFYVLAQLNIAANFAHMSHRVSVFVNYIYAFSMRILKAISIWLLWAGYTYGHEAWTITTNIDSKSPIVSRSGSCKRSSWKNRFGWLLSILFYYFIIWSYKQKILQTILVIYLNSFLFAGNTDIHNGNLKLILGLIWSLIAHYQLGASNFPPKKLMLAWLKVRKTFFFTHLFYIL